MRWQGRIEVAEGAADAVILLAVLSDVISGTSSSHRSPAGSSLDMPGLCTASEVPEGLSRAKSPTILRLWSTQMRRTLDTIIGNRKRIL